MLNLLFGATSLVGLGLNLFGQSKQAAGAKLQSQGAEKQAQGAQMQIQANMKEEAARFQQMTLDATRTKRQLIRQSLMQKAIAESNAVNQGAGTGGSGLAGGYAQIDTSASRQIEEVSQNYDLGKQIFDANMDYFKGSQVISEGALMIGQGGGQAAQGVGMSNLGNSIYSSASTIARLGTFAFGQGSTDTTSNRSGANDIFR